MPNMLKYKHTQYATLVIVLLLPIIAFIVYATYFQIGTKPLTLVPALMIILTIATALLFFYKLTIFIDDEKIVAIFGIGILKREFLLKEIDFDTLEKVNFSALTGIGLRLTKKGWLWNTKVGDAVYFKNKTGNKTFLVGTDHYKEISKILTNNGL